MADAVARRCGALLDDAKKLKDKERRGKLVEEVLEQLSRAAPDDFGDALVRKFLEFRSDPLPSVRRAVATAIERGLKASPSVLRITHEPLQFLVHDRVDSVQRRALLALESNLRRIIRWLLVNPQTGLAWAPATPARGGAFPPEYTAAWRTVLQIKDRVLGQLDMPDTPGMVRSAIFQLCETLALCLSAPPTHATFEAAAAAAYGSPPVAGITVPPPHAYRYEDAAVRAANSSVTLDSVPAGHPVLAREALAGDGRRVARKLMALLNDNPSIRADRDAGGGAIGIGSSYSRGAGGGAAAAASPSAASAAPHDAAAAGGSSSPAYDAATYSDLLARVGNLAYCRPALLGDAVAAVARFVAAPPAAVATTLPKSAPTQAIYRYLPPSQPLPEAPFLALELCAPARAALHRLTSSPACAPHVAALGRAFSALQVATAVGTALRAVGSADSAAKASGAASGTDGSAPASAADGAGKAGDHAAAGTTTGAAPSAPRGLLASMMAGGGGGGASSNPQGGYRSVVAQPAAPAAEGGAAAVAHSGGERGDQPTQPPGVPLSGTSPHVAGAPPVPALALSDRERARAAGNAFSVADLLALPELDDLAEPSVHASLADLVLRGLSALPPTPPGGGSSGGASNDDDAAVVLERLLEAVLAASEAPEDKNGGLDAVTAEGEGDGGTDAAGGGGAGGGGGGPVLATTSYGHPAVRAWLLGATEEGARGSGAAPPSRPGAAAAAATVPSPPPGFSWASCGTSPAVAANDAIRRVAGVALARINDALVDPTAAPHHAEALSAATRHRGVVTAAETSAGALAAKAAARKAAETASELAVVVRSCVGRNWSVVIDRLVAMLELAARSLNAAVSAGGGAVAGGGGGVLPPLDLIAEALLPSPPPAALDAPGEVAAGAMMIAKGGAAAAVAATSGGEQQQQQQQQLADGGGAAAGDEEDAAPPPTPVSLTGASLHRLQRLLLLCCHRLWMGHVAQSRRLAALQPPPDEEQQQHGDDVGDADVAMHHTEEEDEQQSSSVPPPSRQNRKRDRATAGLDHDGGSGTGGGADLEHSFDSAVQHHPGQPSLLPPPRHNLPHALLGDDDHDPLGYFTFTPQCMDLLLSLTLAAAQRAADRLAVLAPSVESDPASVASAASALADVAAGDTLTAFALDAPSLPPVCLDLLASACASSHPLARASRRGRAYELAFGPHRRAHVPPHLAPYVLSPSNTPEGITVGVLRELMLLRPALRMGALDALCAIALADSSVDNARRLAARVLSKRAACVPGAAEQVIAFCRAFLRRLQEAGTSQARALQRAVAAAAAAAQPAASSPAPSPSTLQPAAKRARMLDEKGGVVSPVTTASEVGVESDMADSAAAATEASSAGAVAATVTEGPPAGAGDGDAPQPHDGGAPLAAGSSSSSDNEGPPLQQQLTAEEEATTSEGEKGQPSPARGGADEMGVAPEAVAAAAEDGFDEPPESSLLLVAGCDAGVSACFEVNDALARACAPDAPMSQRTALIARLLQLWVALCATTPALLSELVGVYVRAATTAAAAAAPAAAAAAAAAAGAGTAAASNSAAVAGASPILAMLRAEATPLLRALAKALPGHHAEVLRLLLSPQQLPASVEGGGGGAPAAAGGGPPQPLGLHPAAGPFLHFACSVLIDDACEALAPVAAAVAEREAAAGAAGESLAPPAGGPRPLLVPAARMTALSSVLPHLLATARSVRLLSPAGEGGEQPLGDGPDVVLAGSLPYGGFGSLGDFATASFAALLPPGELRGLLDRTLEAGTPQALRYLLSTRLLRTPHVAPSIPLPELGALLLEGGDVLLKREGGCSLAEKLQLVGEVTNALFERPAGGAAAAAAAAQHSLFNDAAVLGAIGKTVDRALARWQAGCGKGAPPPSPCVPLLLMKCVLLLVNGSVDQRGGAVGVLTQLLKRMGASVFEPPEPGITRWSSTGNASGASVWDGFIRVVKAALPLSFMLLPALPEAHLRLLLEAKSEGVLRDRFRTWFASWSGRDTSPPYVRAIVAALPPPAVAPPKPAAVAGGGGSGAAGATAAPVAPAVTGAPAAGGV